MGERGGAEHPVAVDVGDELCGVRVGEDVDLRQPLPSDLILAAAEADPSIRAAAAGYLRMTALPSSLQTVEPRAHAVYATGWRPAPAPGPTRDELAGIVHAALHAAPALAVA